MTQVPMTTAVVPEVAASAVLRSILMSLGQLKYLHAPLIDAIMAW